MKQCSKCEERKDESCFHKNSQSDDGLRPSCKACDEIVQKRYRERNRGALAKKQRVRRERIRKKWARLTEVDWLELERTEIKRCSKCGLEKKRKNFYRKKDSKDGHSSQCKACRRKKGKEEYNKDPEKFRERQSEQREKRQEQIKAYRKRRNKTHKDVIRKRHKNWYEQNKGYLLRYNRRYRQQNPDKVKAWQHRYRARKEGAPGDFTAEEFKALCEKYNNRCLRCGEKADLGPDHVVPLSKGGSNDIDNIQPLCKPCNSAKNDRYIDYRPSAGNPGLWEQSELPID